HQSHLAASAKMVDFAGWEMPIHYGSQLNEHKTVRSDAGMFDVSHMTVVDVAGSDAKAYLSYLLANDVDKLTTEGKALYSCMLNESAGIVDDLIVYWLGGNKYRVVINSATRDKDLGWLNQHASKFSGLELTEREDVAMIAVQGPDARTKALSLFGAEQHEIINNLERFAAATVGDYFVARTGYTGEDGFELLMPNSMACGCWQTLLDAG
ncbi:MAG: glycine cleavage system protein T, partial [Aestuariibacter sp.]|nr:glycine cleavage system protein T [Aestuariibacter sp.]